MALNKYSSKVGNTTISKERQTNINAPLDVEIDGGLFRNNNLVQPVEGSGQEANEREDVFNRLCDDTQMQIKKTKQETNNIHSV